MTLPIAVGSTDNFLAVALTDNLLVGVLAVIDSLLPLGVGTCSRIGTLCGFASLGSNQEDSSTCLAVCHTSHMILRQRRRFFHLRR